MKKLFLILLLCSSGVHAQPYFTPGTGCVWNESRGTCMVANNHKEQIVCEIRVQVTTNKNQKTTKVTRVIDPQDYYKTVSFKPSWDDKIEKAQVVARCKSK